MRLTRTGRYPAIPRFIGIIDGLCGVAKYCCFDDSIDNAYTAIMERVCYHAVPGGFAPPTVPNLEVVTQMLSGFTEAFKKMIVRTVPVALQVYPELNYRGRKLRLYQRARDHVLGRTYGNNFGALKTFIKHEKILVKDKRLVPRVIQPRSPEYNVCVGRYIRQLEHRVYQMIDKLWGGSTVMKGLNCVQQGASLFSAWSSFANPVGIMLDAVRFDQHVSVPMLSWEHAIYLQFFPPVYRPELEWLLSMQLFNRGTVRCPDGTINYRSNGCRASGDMNTAMGNVLIMCGTMYSYIQSLGIKARLINNGDDCCLIVERGDVDLVRSSITEYYSRLGFIIDMEGTASCLEEVGFCQTHPVYDGRRYVMVRDPRTAISKDVTIIKRWADKEYAVYLRELGIAGLSAYGNMPIFASFYRCLSRSEVSGAVSEGLRQHVRGPILDTGLGRLSEGVDNRGVITDSCRTSFAIAFGLSPCVQYHLEGYYDQCHPGTRRIHPGVAGSKLF